MFTVCSLALHAFTKAPAFPKTPKNAVAALLSDLDAESLGALSRIQMEELPRYDQPLRWYCKTMLGLDGRNKDLTKACCVTHPDHAIELIIQMAWRAVRQAS